MFKAHLNTREAQFASVLEERYCHNERSTSIRKILGIETLSVIIPEKWSSLFSIFRAHRQHIQWQQPEEPWLVLHILSMNLENFQSYIPPVPQKMRMSADAAWTNTFIHSERTAPCFREKSMGDFSSVIKQTSKKPRVKCWTHENQWEFYHRHLKTGFSPLVFCLLGQHVQTQWA